MEMPRAITCMPKPVGKQFSLASSLQNKDEKLPLIQMLHKLDDLNSKTIIVEGIEMVENDDEIIVGKKKKKLQCELVLTTTNTPEGVPGYFWWFVD